MESDLLEDLEDGSDVLVLLEAHHAILTSLHYIEYDNMNQFFMYFCRSDIDLIVKSRKSN